MDVIVGSDVEVERDVEVGVGNKVGSLIVWA
jgi:hypothetical protein